MEAQRIKTNIIELSKLKTSPPEYWLEKFKDGELDAFEFFEDGEEYEWLYENSDYDLIGWEIENGVFDWEHNSWIVAKHCPENFDAEKYNWSEFSGYVAEYCPDKLDPDKYNWGENLCEVAKYCPEKINLKKFEYCWIDVYELVKKYSPDKANLMVKNFFQMKSQRIKTNIIELSELRMMPCEEWLERFEDNKIDAHKAFKQYGEEYEWLYRNSDYDLIGWEIENGVFDWDKHSWAVAEYHPKRLDPDRYNWKKDSWAVARYCPDKLDPERFNWDEHSWVIAQSCPERLDPEKYNWEKDSWAVAEHCPDKLDPEKYNWKDFSYFVVRYCPNKLDPERFNWNEYLYLVETYCPEKLSLMSERYKQLNSVKQKKE